RDTLPHHIAMTKRRKWTAIPGLVALAAGAVILSAYSGASSSQNSSPTQPIAFPHSVHVGKLGINCIYCHYSANDSPDPGLPAVSTCIGCHTLIGPDRPASDLGPKRKSVGIQTLWQYAGLTGKPAKPIPWVRIHKLPEYVHFPHMRHVNAGVACQACHGPIQTEDKVYQYASLNMGWCIDCHVKGYDPKQGEQMVDMVPNGHGGAELPAADQAITATPDSLRKKARYDCSVCHY
ncbi:MAG: cytochrome c3 family protein, partial [Gemmatimonadaceae bacterium]